MGNLGLAPSLHRPRTVGVRSPGAAAHRGTRRTDAPVLRFGALRRQWARWRRGARTLGGAHWTDCAASDGSAEHHLLLVRHRRVVGEISYRLCGVCPAGQMTTQLMLSPLPKRRVLRQAMSHLRFRHPGRCWLPRMTSTGPVGRRRFADSRLCPGHDEAGYSLPASIPFPPER
ncbi:hypothetical protein [Streptomyces sp. NPDC049916]|uniref:hypothetical protein n=1 Tax=Streptomyces sp. NPDC049916 TaxID=3155156 RepID=UPI003428DB7F